MTDKLSAPEKNMLLFLSADAIMTLTLFAAFAYLRLIAPHWPAAFHFGSGLMAAAMTMFLLSGSFTMFLAVRATHGGEADREAPARWVAVTVATWCCFLLLEGLEWARLSLIVGVTLRANPWNVPLFGATYFIPHRSARSPCDRRPGLPHARRHQEQTGREGRVVIRELRQPDLAAVVFWLVSGVNRLARFVNRLGNQ